MSIRYVFMFFLVFCGWKIHAQDINDIHFYFAKDSVEIKENKSFMNFFILDNSSSQTFTIKDLKPVKDYPGLLISPEGGFKLLPHEIKKIPLKVLADSRFLISGFSQIEYLLTAETNKGPDTLKASFDLVKEEEFNLFFSNLSREYYLLKESETTIDFFLENRNYSTAHIEFEVSARPDELEVLLQKEDSIKPLERQLVHLEVRLKNRKPINKDYQISIRARDLKTKKQTTAHFKLISLSEAKQVVPVEMSKREENFAEIQFGHNSSGTDYWRLKANHHIALSKKFNAEVNFTSEYFLHNDQFNIYDSWIELSDSRSFYKAGSIQGYDFDYSVYGQGLSLGHAFKRNRKLEILGLRQSFGLFSNTQSFSENPKIIAAKYNFENSNKFKGKISYLTDHNSRSNTITHLSNFQSDFILDSLHHFSTEAGLSYEKGRILKDEQVGGNLKLNYATTYRNWDLKSANAYSTKTYSGLNRGIYSFDQYLSYHKNRWGYFFQIYLSQINPKPLKIQLEEYEHITPLYYFYSDKSFRTGLNLSLNKWRFLFSPQMDWQKSRVQHFENGIQAFRFKTSAGTSFWKNHNINIGFDYSYLKLNSADFSSHGIRSNISYFYKRFSLNGTIQFNPYSANDFNYLNQNPKDFTDYNLFSSYSFHFKNPAIQGSISAGIRYSELYKNNNFNWGGYFEYALNRHWALNVQGSYYTSHSTFSTGYRGENYQIQMGLKKHFIPMTNAENNKIQLTLFYDQNVNNFYDEDEIPIANQLVKLDEHSAVTDSEGKVRFLNVPDGVYKLKVLSEEGLRLNVNSLIQVERNLKLEIPMVKKQKLKGQLIEVRQAYDQEETNASGITVFARDQDGKVFSTLVNTKHEFEFFLDPGKYEVYIKNNQFEFSEVLQQVEILYEEEPEVVFFEYKKRGREIRVKKFD